MAHRCDWEGFEGQCPFALLNQFMGASSERVKNPELFERFVDQIHTIRIEECEDYHRRLLIRYALTKKRCDLIELWLPHAQGDGVWTESLYHFTTDLLPVLPGILASGVPNPSAVRTLIYAPETWPYLVYYNPHPWFDVTHGIEPASFWEFFCEAIGPSVVEDPRILYRALTTMVVNTAPVIWRYVADKQRMLDYRGKIGTIRELFALRQIWGLEELPPAPSDCPLLAPVFTGETTIRDSERTYTSALTASPELAEHVYLCSNRRSPYTPADNGYLSSVRDFADYITRSNVASRRERQYALLALDFCSQPFKDSQRRYAEEHLERLLSLP